MAIQSKIEPCTTHAWSSWPVVPDPNPTRGTERDYMILLLDFSSIQMVAVQAVDFHLCSLLKLFFFSRFVCQFNIEGRVTSVNAQLLGDVIYCDEMEFAYTSRAPNISATFAVIWGGSKPLDNPENIHVLI